jgi:hypothetical protein
MCHTRGSGAASSCAAPPCMALQKRVRPMKFFHRWFIFFTFVSSLGYFCLNRHNKMIWVHLRPLKKTGGCCLVGTKMSMEMIAGTETFWRHLTSLGLEIKHLILFLFFLKSTNLLLLNSSMGKPN